MSQCEFCEHTWKHHKQTGRCKKGCPCPMGASRVSTTAGTKGPKKASVEKSARTLQKLGKL